MSLGMDRVLLSDIWKFETKEDINIFYDIIKQDWKNFSVQTSGLQKRYSFLTIEKFLKIEKFENFKGFLNFSKIFLNFLKFSKFFWNFQKFSEIL